MKQTHLPKNQTQREQLTKNLTEILNNLTSSLQSNPNRQLPSQIQILKLRLKLISDCAQLSVQRISNLQQIFKHYCTHIFKIGKHMTFERLQYQKVHLTLDRFCVFLKDFGLISTKIDQIQYQIIDKQEIVRNFKRISKNCRDLSFQQFIACLQKLAIIYYDEKQIYKIKKQKFKQERQARIIEYRKKMKLKQKQQQARKLKNSSQYIQAQQQNQNQQQNQEKQKQKQEHEQNDDLIQKMMADQKIQHPNNQIKNINNTNQLQNQFGAQSKNKTKKHEHIRNMPQYCNLTAQQKIQYFYQLISIDNLHDFRKKMSQLGLPLFKQYQPTTHSKIGRTSKSNADLLNVVIQNDHKQDQRRLIQLRQKLNIKKQRDKHLYSPSLSKQQYQQRKKKRQQKQQQLLQQANGGSRIQIQKFANDKQRQRKKIELMDKQLSLDVLNNIAYDDLKNKYNLQKYIHNDQTDQIYLNQYGIQIQPINSLSKKSRKQIQAKSLLRQNTATTLQRKRTSSNIVQDFKKRAYEMQVKQFHKEAQLTRFVHSMKRKQKFRNQIIGNI